MDPFDEFAKAINKAFCSIANRGVHVKEVVFNPPCTIVNWSDGEKTVVRCQEGDAYDKRTGLLLCIAKRSFGNNGSYNDVLNEFAPEGEE